MKKELKFKLAFQLYGTKAFMNLTSPRLMNRDYHSPNDTAFPQSDQHPSKGCKTLPALLKAPTVPLFYALPVKFPMYPAKESPW